jgi:hypothetical protein
MKGQGLTCLKRHFKLLLVLFNNYIVFVTSSSCLFNKKRYLKNIERLQKIINKYSFLDIDLNLYVVVNIRNPVIMVILRHLQVTHDNCGIKKSAKVSNLFLINIEKQIS